ncbi:hypothetical protein [Paucibacter sp. XJ19-41]|uniref:hypothetical protein n=1 Tax=Paucibacter sp. XJ19-41 TaxID=2927824 RepID=UPI00234BBA2D|nr:hypothetical protein [Paucibacter sp. XJ19-41]MDC6166632.1 hypothetical protein [Paucibacter sp. XJ19-41]
MDEGTFHTAYAGFSSGDTAGTAITPSNAGREARLNVESCGDTLIASKERGHVATMHKLRSQLHGAGIHSPKSNT